MTDADRLHNMLGRMEVLLDLIRTELELTRIDRGETLSPDPELEVSLDRLVAGETTLANLRAFDDKADIPEPAPGSLMTS
jgi:hypothetical protein